MPRAMVAKWLIGLSIVNGCIHSGIASTGVVAPESIESGGLTKKLINCACCCDLLKVARHVAMTSPGKTQNHPGNKNRRKSSKNRKHKTQSQKREPQHEGDREKRKKGGLVGGSVPDGLRGGHNNFSNGPRLFLFDHRRSA